MHDRHARAATGTAILALVFSGSPLAAQHTDAHPPPSDASPSMEAHTMWTHAVGADWTAMGMAQLFPIVTFGAPFLDEGPMDATGWYVTQPAMMVNLESPETRVVLRTTLNFEGLTQKDGELTPGGWGEGFIDKRHPHTLLHEFVLSVNGWGGRNGDASVSAGKGFAPYGTSDPMARPAVKYPTNHHLSQVLERWFVSASYLRAGWGLEAGIFGGSEPEGPYDFSNIDSFGDSWSVRLSKRWPTASMEPGWEVSASHARVVEEHAAADHDGEAASVTTRLWNGAIRYEGDSTLRYALMEASTGLQPGEDDFFSVLLEARFRRGRSEPYLRAEYATRPEYERNDPNLAPGFFRYEHAAEPIGATRWLISTLGYAWRWTELPVAVRPFAEVQHVRVREERGGIDPVGLFGESRFWSLTIGTRIFLGGDPMRMGAYGVLDSMTRMGRASSMDGM